MDQKVTHQPRLAWDAARAFVSAVDSDGVYFWLIDRLGELLGAEFQRTLSDTRTRVLWPQRPDAVSVETGTWRVRLEDVLRSRPEVGVPLRDLVDELSAKLSAPYWPAWLD